MADFRYGELPLDLLQALLTYEELLKLFLDLVNRTAGDVERAMAWMKELQRRGLVSAGEGPQDVRAAAQGRGGLRARQRGKLMARAPPDRRVRHPALPR